jgi:nucleotide-binding universal stress UspA family protein
MFKKILVPLDTSKMSEIALPYAEALAIKLGAEMVLLHVGTLADSADKSDRAEDK